MRSRILSVFSFFFAMTGHAAPDYISPEFTSEGTVILRYYAPAAQQVFTVGLGLSAPQPMTRNADGLWSLQLTTLPDGIYDYRFEVDGAAVLDPRNSRFKRWIHPENSFELSRDGRALWAVQNVPHGTLVRIPYFSETSQSVTSLVVYCPPGYKKESPPLPMLVLCHGYGDDEGAWSESGRVNFIADNLIAQGRMVPMLIVMPNGHPIARQEPRPTDYLERNRIEMEKRLLLEVLPEVAQRFNVSSSPEQRAIAGLSMGGGHALMLGFRHPEVFSWVGAFSAAVPELDWEALKRQEPETRRKLLWLAIGQSDFLWEPNQRLRSWLESERVPHTFVISDGGHEWRLWRDYVASFLEQVFQEKARSAQ